MIANLNNKPDNILVKYVDEWEKVSEGVEIDVDTNIYIESKRSVKMLRLEWNHNISSDALILNDHWERGYGDLGWSKINVSKVYPWYFMLKSGDDVFGIGVKTCPNAFCYWYVNEKKLICVADIRSGLNGLNFAGRRLKVAELVQEKYSGDTFVATQCFCKKMSTGARLPQKLVYGCNDWYCCYGKNSYESTMLHVERINECSKGLENRPYMVIDDGWEVAGCAGPWVGCNSKFKDMKKVADAIKKENVIPGIWYRPLLTTEDTDKEWLLGKDDEGLYLDPSHPEVIKQLKSDMKHLCDNGYKLIKHDFSTYDIVGKIWGFEMENGFEVRNRNFYDDKKTTAEIIKNMYQALRDAAGDSVLLLGCNTVSHLSAGYFEIQRTGDDTSGAEWGRTRKMGLNTLAFRMPQHNSFYACDADCVGLTNEVPWEKNKQWLDVLSKSGTPLFVSIGEDAYGTEQKDAIMEAFSRAAVNSEISIPLDWETEITPKVWKSAYGTDSYNW